MVLGRMNYLDGLQELIKSAENGDVEAQYTLGYCYYSSDGIEKNGKQAIAWLTKATNQGHANVQYILWSCHFEDKGG